MRFGRGGSALERLAGSARGADEGAPARWRTVPGGSDPWDDAGGAGDVEWVRGRRASLVREALQQGLLFPVARLVARPRVVGAEDLAHVPQPAIIAPNHASDIDTPLVLAALPRAWRARTVVGAASDRFYRRRRYAVAAGLAINTFPFDRGGDLRGLADAAELLREGHNVLLYPQATRSAGGLEGFRTGVGRLAISTGAPLVPVHIGGTALIMPKERGLIQRGRASVTFGPPLHPRPGEDAHALTERATEAVARLAPRRAS